MTEHAIGRAGEVYSERMPTLKDRLWYGTTFDLEAVAEPAISSSTFGYEQDVYYHSDIYTQIEFVMEHPSIEEREQGVVYLAPTQEEKTKAAINRLNEIIASDDTIVLDKGLEYPLALEDIISKYDAVMAIIHQMSTAQRGYFEGYEKAPPPPSNAQSEQAPLLLETAPATPLDRRGGVA
ncbi:MAG: hypothetical protein LBP24_03595 [Coriobacteriales bacterium]|nr:hypothetical protein [Coriobacteriales bacterium]